VNLQKVVTPLNPGSKSETGNGVSEFHKAKGILDSPVKPGNDEKGPKSADLSLRAKRSNLVMSLI
jgi:hypothetical protein